jgi:hypothetical protein
VTVRTVLATSTITGELSAFITWSPFSS